MKPTYFIPETLEGLEAGKATRLKATDLSQGEVYLLASQIDRSFDLEAALLPVRLERIAPWSGQYGLILSTLTENMQPDFSIDGGLDDENIFKPYNPEHARITPNINRIGQHGLISASYFRGFEGVENNGLHLPAHLIEHASPELPFGSIVRR